MPRHKCETCGKTFDLKRYLTKHELRMHNPDKVAEDVEPMEALKCSMCDKVFPRLSHLQRHQMTHFNVRNWACEHCDEKFVQKTHLTRHVSRKHPEVVSSADVAWFACDTCGNLFKTADEMQRHRATVHTAFRCPKCEEVQDGSESLRTHQMKCRNESEVCSHCGASFARPADLAAHRVSCLKKVAFVCTPCDEYFKQRVQLDRHIKKFHFRSSKCSNCTFIGESPVQHARHSLECRQIVVCGYCNQRDPDREHVAEQHWKKLKRPVTVGRARREAELEKRKRREANERKEGGDEDVGECSGARAVEENDEVDDVLRRHSGEKEDDGDDDDREPQLGRTISEDSDDTHHGLLDNFAESTSSHLNFQSTAFREDDETAEEEFLVFSICPKNTALSYDLRGRLPARLAELFPVLEETSIVLLNSTESVSSRSPRMTVQVPVQIPRDDEHEEEMREWLEKTIILDRDVV